MNFWRKKNENRVKKVQWGQTWYTLEDQGLGLQLRGT